MCLGIPAKIILIDDDDSILMPAKVDFGGLSKTISLSLTPDAKVGDYVLVHAGFSISIIDEKRAQELIAFLTQEGFSHEIPS